SGLVRAIGLVVRGEPLWSVLGPAFTSPTPPCARARPPRVLCSDPELQARLAAELGGADIAVERVDRLPALDLVVASLRDHLEPIPAPGITVDTRLWASVLETFTELAP